MRRAGLVLPRKLANIARKGRHIMSKAAMKKPPENEKPVYHNELIHEVEEALKREELERFWQEYRFFIIGAVVAAILLTAAVSGWQSYKYKTNTAQTAILTGAMSAEEDNLAAALGDAAPKLRGGHRAMAFLTEAGALQRAGKRQEALEVYSKAAADGSLPRVWQDLAVLLSTRAAWGMETEKTENAASLLKAIAPLLKDQDSPWHAHALLLAAQIEAHGNGDYQAAHKYLSDVQQVADAPPSLRERAKALDHIFMIRSGAVKKGTQQ